MTDTRDFCRERGIKLTLVSIPARPDQGVNDDWHEGARHYVATLAYGKAPLTTFYSQGSGIKNPPVAADILDSLISDACSFESVRDVEEFAREFGYDDAGARKQDGLMERAARCQRVYDACKKIRQDLISTLGETLYVELRDNVERL